MDISQIIGPIIIALITSLLGSGIWALIAQRRKTAAEVKREEAEATEIIQRIAGNELKKQQDQIDRQEHEIEDLQNQIRQLKADLKNIISHYQACIEGAQLLFTQVRKYEEPVYTPPPVELVRQRKKALE